MARLLLLTLLLVGCATSPPVIEYTIARTALLAAKKASASRYSPGHWHTAETAFIKGQKYYYDEDYAEAAKQFKITIEYAEKSENVARVEQLKAGEIQ